jgi:hypothetical protein
MSATINTNLVKQIAALASVSFIVAVVLFFLDIQFFPARPYMKPADGAFIEGILLVLSGLLIFIGSGGIGQGSRKAAMLASAAKAISDKEVIGPSEIYRRDTWKSKGYTRLGLVLNLTGLSLLITYFAFP